MAVFTGIHRFIVRERLDDGHPGPGVVARFASITGNRVSSGFVLGVMTTACDAIGNNRLIMSKRQCQGQPVGNGMAALTQIGGMRVIRSLA